MSRLERAVGSSSMNRTALICSGLLGVICAAAMATLVSWPPTDPITWQPLHPLEWWQFEWLAAVGFLLSALPSLLIFKLDAFFAANEYLRNPVAAVLTFVEVLTLCVLVYRVVSVFAT